MEKNDQRMKKIKFFGTGYTISNVLWWISFFILIIAGVIFKELQRRAEGADSDKRMKSLTKVYIGVWIVWAIVDIWFTVWGIYLQHDILIPYLVITLAALIVICGIWLARRSTFP